MRKMKWLLVGALLVVPAVGGCKGGKEAKCTKAFDQMTEITKSMAAAMGGKGDEIAKKMEAGKGKFMEACKQLPDDAMDCLADIKGKMLDPKCMASLAKLRMK